MLLDQIAVGLRAPRIWAAGNADMGTQLRMLDPGGEAANRLCEGGWTVEPGFIDGIEIEPCLTLRIEPLCERIRASDLERAFERVVDVLNADEERGKALLLDIPRSGFHFECLAATGFRQDYGAVSAVDFWPRLEVVIPEECPDFLVVGIVI